MAFNHYAKLKRIIETQPNGWYIRRIDSPTSTKNFRNEVVHYEYYYRLYDRADQPIPYGKFQKLDALAQILRVPVDVLPLRFATMNNDDDQK